MESQKPSLKTEKINVINIQPSSKFNLPTYHLTGDYLLTVKNTHLSKHFESQQPLLKIEKINLRNIQSTSKFNLPT